MALLETVFYYLIAFLAIGFLIVYLYFKNNYTYWQKVGVPHLKPSFPFGNFQDVFLNKKQLGLYMTEISNDMKSKGHKFFGVYFIQNPAVIINDPDLVRSVLAKDSANFINRGVHYNEETDPLSATLFSLEDQKWKNLRAKLTPTFTSGKMKKMFQTLVDCSLELRDCLNEPIRKGEPIDIKKISGQYTTDVIGSCAFGIDCNSFQDSETEFIRIGKKVFLPDTKDKIRQFFTFTFPTLQRCLKIKMFNKNIEDFYVNLVKDTIEYREKNNITRNDFLQLLMQLKNKGTVEMDDHEDTENEYKDHKEDFKFTMGSLTAQAFIFFAAGFETSATTITWTLYELSKYEKVQNKLREEIVRVLKKYDGKITYEALKEMRYMDHVVQEALRKFPPINMLQRVATANYQIPDTDVIIKKGQPVFIPVHAIQNDPEYYPDPDTFDPDRFTEEEKATRPDYTWLPFGEGPRICIGLRFALMQVKVGLTQLLLNYKFTLNAKTLYPPVIDPYSFATASKHPILLNAERVIN